MLPSPRDKQDEEVQDDQENQNGHDGAHEEPQEFGEIIKHGLRLGPADLHDTASVAALHPCPDFFVHRPTRRADEVLEPVVLVGPRVPSETTEQTQQPHHDCVPMRGHVRRALPYGGAAPSTVTTPPQRRHVADCRSGVSFVAACDFVGPRSWPKPCARLRATPNRSTAFI